MPPDAGTTKLGPLTNREKQLIFFLRKLEWGEVKVRVEKGQPVVIYEAIKTLKLEEGKKVRENPDHVGSSHGL